MRIRITLPILLLFSFIGISCLWDNDTIEMEKQKFPEVYDLLTGNFLRHSNEYYEWRIKDRTEKLKTDPKNPNLYDDLAVAYSKLHQDKKAIEIMEQKEKIAPGLYETYANMGTFYLHDGQLEKGIEYIDKAIEINPDAHFGREVYQKYLAEYLISKVYKKGFELPLSKMKDRRKRENNFYDFLLDKLGKEDLDENDLKKAIKGVGGMIKFGNHNSPILLEVMGDLLINSKYDMHRSHKKLGFLAYYRASQETSSEKSRSEYLKKCRFTTNNIEGYYRKEISEIVKDFDPGIDSAQIKHQIVVELEKSWIEKGLDLDVEFAIKYYNKKRTVKDTVVAQKEERLTEEEAQATSSNGTTFINWMMGILIGGFLIVISYIIWKNMRK